MTSAPFSIKYNYLNTMSFYTSNNINLRKTKLILFKIKDLCKFNFLNYQYGENLLL